MEHWLVADTSLRMPGLDPRLCEFVVDKVALGQVFLRAGCYQLGYKNHSVNGMERNNRWYFLDLYETRKHIVWTEDRICRLIRKIEKSDYSLRYVCPFVSTRMVQLGSHWAHFD